MDGSSRTTTLFTDEGPKEWKRLSVRTEEFLTKYPLEDGWRVTSSYEYVLDASPGLLEVAKTAAAAKADLSSFGLGVADIRSVIFRACLVDKQGEVLREASAHKVVVGPKDFEVGESVAYGRLLARLGIGGEILDSDERGDFAAQGITVHDDEPPASPESAPEDETSPEVETSASATPEEAPSQPEQAKTKPKGQQPPKLSRQVKLLVGRKQMKAAELGVEVPDMDINSDADAKALVAKIDEAIKAAEQAEATS